MKFLLTVALAASVLTSALGRIARADDAAKPTIFVCGDSTAKNNGAGRDGTPMVGWGTPIAAFFDPAKATVSNVGHAGKSSLTYYTGDWPAVLPKIKSGDYILLVFGINDGGTPQGLGDEVNGQGTHTYGWYMSKMATDAQEKGAHTYFLTVTTRNIWTNSNPGVKYKDANPLAPLPADYDPKLDKIERGTANGRMTQTTKDVAKKLSLPVFDPHQLLRRPLRKDGPRGGQQTL
jgi:lysophospholipase L1-like esterase